MLIFGFFYLLIIFLIKDKLDKNLLRILIPIPFVLIIVLRFGFGADYFSYDYIYTLFGSQDLNFAFSVNPAIEIFYRLSNVIGNWVGLNYHSFSIIYCTIILIITLRWLRESSEDYALSAFLFYVVFFFVWNLSALRQGITIPILLYIYFNRKDKFSFQTKIVCTLIAFLFHYGSIVVLPIYLLSRLNWDKKKLGILFAVAILASFVPFEMIVTKLDFLPFANKILYYIKQGGVSLFSFSVLVRIFMFGIVFISYDKLNDSKKLPKYTANFILLSYIMYFFLMFADVVAARSAIYGYYLMLLVIPVLLKNYEGKAIRKPIYIGVMLFSIMSFYKESTAMMSQSGYTKSFISFNFETILDKNYTHFDTHHALISHVTSDQMTNSGLEGKPSSLDLKVEKSYSPEDRHISVYFNGYNRFGIITTEGEVVEMPKYEYRFNIIGDKAELILDPFRYPTIIYREIGDEKGIPYEETQSIVQEDTKNKTRFNIFFTKKVDLAPEDLDLSLLEEKFNLSSIDEYIVHNNEYYDNIFYLEMRSDTRTLYAILNEDYSVKIDKLYYNIIKYDIKGIARGVTGEYVDFIDRDGNIIWTEPISKLEK